MLTEIKTILDRLDATLKDFQPEWRKFAKSYTDRQHDIDQRFAALEARIEELEDAEFDRFLESIELIDDTN